MQIIPYQPEYKHFFEQLNREWLEKLFVLEPKDEYVLTQPDEAIIQQGGRILFAEYEDTIIGTVAIIWHTEGEVEIIKMGVNERYQGLGSGKLLFEAAIKTARDMGAKKIVLYSNRILHTALHIYLKAGFVEVPVEKGMYERADIKMEMDL